MKVPAEVFGAYDIRGVAGRDIDEGFARELGAAFGRFACPDKRGSFLVGHDARPQSPKLAAALAAGISSAGHNVVLMGLGSTPAIFWSGAQAGFDGSVAVTASHLAPEYTGFKLARADAVPVGADNGLKVIVEMLSGKQAEQVLVPGTVTNEDVLGIYADELRSFLKPQRVLRIAVDAGNGAAGPEIERVFGSSCALEITGLGLTADGDSSQRPSNPLEEGALNRLSKVVLEGSLDFGVAFDGDADRAIFVDDKGLMVPPDIVMAMLAADLLANNAGATVVYDLRSTRAVPETIKACGGHAVRTRVGHTFIKTAMVQNQALFAGELSGHYYYSDMFDTDNALRTLIQLVNLVSSQKRKLSDLVLDLMSYSTSGEINVKVRNPAEILQRLQEAFVDGDRDLLDGISVDFPNWWFNARASNTEPLLRITAGATGKDLLHKNLERLMNLVNAAAAN